MNPIPAAALAPALLALALLAAPANAASFDCAQAGTAVEHMICGDEALSALDDLLGDRYVRALKKGEDPKAIKAAQRAWLRETRNACTDAACLKAAYEARVADLTKIGWMTDEKAKAICEEVIAMANSRSLGGLFLPSERATADDLKAWSVANGAGYMKPDRVVRLDYDSDGRLEVLGSINNGGARRNQQYVFVDIDLNRRKWPQPFVPDDDVIWRQLLNTEQFLATVAGETITVAVGFGSYGEWDRASSRIVLVSWLAPTGQKFPVCHIGDATMEIEVGGAKDPKLCEAFVNGAVSPIAWSVPIDVIYAEEPDSRGQGFRSIPKGAKLDLDLDGEPEIVTVTYHDLGGYESVGGYSPQPYLTLVHLSNPEAQSISQINGTYLGALNRWLEKTRDPESDFPPALFEYEGKPYVLLGNKWVSSFWNGERRDWCDFYTTGPYEILQLISQDTWPPSAKWAVERNTGKPQ